MTTDTINQITAQTLDVLGLSQQEFEETRSVLLKSEPAWPGATWQPEAAGELTPFIDHTLLAPDATDSQIAQLCTDAVTHRFASVCVNTCHIPACADYLKGSEVKLCAVIGFPLGAMATAPKAAEAQYATDFGATEIDMVMNIGRFKSDADGLLYAFNDIRAVQAAAWGASVKVILETVLLTPEEIVAASTMSIAAGAAFIKTSTGFSKGGATTEAVRLMREIAGPHIGVKASGGIRDANAALAMIQAGANRIGTSSGVSIVTPRS